MKVLFLGNSATYVHEIPQALAKLAAEQGVPFEVTRLTPGGWMLSQHADFSTPHGQQVLEELNKGYDLVILQDNGNCIENEEKHMACMAACDVLSKRIRQSGARMAFYVRPPYGYPVFGRTPFEQCRAFDELFGQLALKHDAQMIPVNRAFACAMHQAPQIPLWGPDNAHTSPQGAYLAVCTFFAALTGMSCAALSGNGLETMEAQMLKKMADSVALEGRIPWQEAQKA